MAKIALLTLLATTHPDTAVVCVKDSCYKAISVKVSRSSLKPGTKVIELK